jgi:hypothetical protein
MTASATVFAKTPRRFWSAWHVTVAIIFLYACIALAFIPLAANPGPRMPGLVTLFTTGIFITELATAYLLAVLFREDRSWSLLLLFCAYVFSALMALLHLLTFPGAILPDQALVVAEEQTAAWIYLAWLYGFALLTLAPVLLEASHDRWHVAPDRAGSALLVTAVAVVAITALIFVGIINSVDALPLMVSEQRFASITTLRAGAVLLFCVSIAVILVKIGNRNHLYLWLSLALTAIVFQNVLASAGGARYSIGWSFGRASWLISAAALFLFFLNLFSKQQRILSRTRDLLERSEEAAASDLKHYEPAHTTNIDHSIERFVARENIGRYQGMLRRSLPVDQREAISNLLAEEKTRLKNLTNGHRSAARPVRIDHLF